MVPVVREAGRDAWLAFCLFVDVVCKQVEAKESTEVGAVENEPQASPSRCLPEELPSHSQGGGGGGGGNTSLVRGE